MITRLKEILVIQSESYKQWRMFAFLIRKLTALEVPFYVNDGCIYATKGISDIYPCVVAHMDTVHDICEDLAVLEVGNKLTGFNRVKMKQTGIGGDDKVGIYLALELLMKFDNIKVAFFRDEEIGCGGSYNAELDFFSNCSFVLQGDRRGNKDFIHRASGTQLCSKNFKKVISPILKKYKYDFEEGMMTDVMALKEIGLSISCANISCGYYNPHMAHEYVNIPDVMNCLALMDEIITLHGNIRWEHKAHKAGKGGYYSGKWSSWDDEYVPPKQIWNANTKQWEVTSLGYDKIGRTKLTDAERDDVWRNFKPFENDESEDFYDNTPVVNHCDFCQQSLPLTFVHNYNAYLCSDCATYFEPVR